MRCGVCGGSLVLSYGFVRSPSCSGFPCHPQDLPVAAEERELVGDKLCPSLPGLPVTIPPLSKVPQQNGWSRLAGEVCGSWEGACWRSRGTGEGMTPDPCGATVPLRHPPVTGPSHLTRLDTSGSVGLTTAEGERSSSPETPLTLYPEGLILLLQ